MMIMMMLMMVTIMMVIMVILVIWYRGLIIMIQHNYVRKYQTFTFHYKQ